MAIQAGDSILASHFNEIVPIGVVLPYAGASAPTGFLLCDGSAVSRTTYSALFAIISTTFGVGDGSTTFNLPDMRSRMPIGAGTAGTFATSFLAGAVDTGTDQITVTSNDSLKTGTAVVLTTTGSLPGGLSLATTYYVIYVSSTVIKLATSLANAIAGTAINITSQGSGTHTATVTYTARSLGAVGGEESHAITVAEMGAHDHGGVTSTDGAHTHSISDPGHTHTIDVVPSDQDGSGSNGSISGSKSTGVGYTGISINSGGSHSHTISSQGGSTAHNNMTPYLALNFIIKYISYA